MREFLHLVFFFSIFGTIAQINIIAPDEACLDESISIQVNPNIEEGSIIDLCHNDLQTVINVEDIINLTEMNAPQAIEIVFDNDSWYGFIASKSTNEVFRLDFGSSLTNVPTLNNLGDFGIDNLRPNGIKHIQENGVWYSFLIAQHGSLYRLRYDDDLTSQLTYENLGDLGPWLTVIDIKLSHDKDSDNWVLGVLDTGNDILSFVEFGNSITNDPIAVNSIDDVRFNNINAFDFESTELGWFALISDDGNDKVFKGFLGESIASSFESLTEIISTVNPNRIELVSEGLEYTAFILGSNNGLSRIDFGTDLQGNGQVYDLGTFDGLLNRGNGFTIVRNSSTWHGFVIDWSNLILTRIDFESSCQNSVSVDFIASETGTFHYMEGGEYLIEVVTGDNILTSDTIKILPQTAPSISFTTDNACVSFEGAFDADTPDLTYAWDFGDGSIASGQNTSHQFASSGTYTVRLDVDDGTCSNFTEQEITIYEEPPVPDFEVVGNLCADGEITFNNLTSDGGYTGPLTYEWDFDGQATADTRDASFVFGSEGSKTVTLTSSIPGCENFFQTVIDLQPGPTSLFSGSSVCQNELMQFTNTSSDADTYMWDFGDGFTSTQADASHVYTSSGNFTVQLEAFDLDGCSAIYEQEVAISPEPVADFSYDVACKGNQGVDFTDQSTVSGADILAWEWRVNDQLISTEQSPTLSFDETGLVDVSLTVTSSNGCTQLYEETLDVLEDPDPAIQADISCQSLVSTFTDNSANPETIVSRVWEIEGQTYTTQEVQHTFSGSGQIDVNLTVTGQNFCSSTLYTTVEIQPAASMNFSVSSYCDNDQIIFQDQSTSIDPIVSRTWTLDGETFFNGSTAALEQISSGTYTIGLSAQTESGCTFETEQIIDINEAPEAAFSPSATYGAPPFTLSLTNNSTGATTYRWLVNGNEIATSANTTYTISEEGDHTVELVASNASGCEDRQSINVISRVPAINLIVSDLTLTPNGNSQNVTLRVSNNGNLPIEIFDVFVSSSNDFSFSERINQMIEIGSEVDVQLNSTLQATSSQRICVKIQSAYDDLNPDTNEACINFTPKVVFEDIYPNPFKNEAVVRFILPKSSKVRVTIANSTGKLMIKESYSMNEGLQILRYNSSQWEKGLYFITVLYNGEMTTKRVLKF